MIRPIMQHGSPILTRVCTPVDLSQALPTQVISDLKETLRVQPSHTKGLSAKHIGINQRIVAVRTQNTMYMTYDNSITIMINPEIIHKEVKVINHHRTCPSMVGVQYTGYMYNNVTVSYQDEHGLSHEEIYLGENAFIMQHFISTLDGKTLFDEVM